jgi:hypothetical protein
MNAQNTTTFNFRDVSVGSTTMIYVGGSLPEVYVHRRGARCKRYVREDDVAALFAKRPKLETAWGNFLCERRRRIGEWMHETPHSRYDCDGGTLKIRVNGSTTIRLPNGYGDGNFPFYIVPEAPEFFDRTNVSLDGECEIEVFDYDCAGGKVCARAKVKDPWFFYRNGAVCIAGEIVEPVRSV